MFKDGHAKPKDEGSDDDPDLDVLIKPRPVNINFSFLKKSYFVITNIKDCHKNICVIGI